jgi:methyl-accepting chemotaxis protein
MVNNVLTRLGSAMKLTQFVGILPLVSIVSMLSIGSVFIYADYDRYQKKTNEEHIRALTEDLVKVRSDINAINAAAYKSLVMSSLGFSEKAVQELVTQQLALIQQLIPAMEQILAHANEQQKPEINNIIKNIQSYNKSVSSVFDMVTSDATYGTQLMGSAEREFNKAREGIQTFYDQTVAYNQQIDDDLVQSDRRNFYLILATSALAMLAILSFSIGVIRRISKRSRHIVDAIAHLEETGNFNATVSLDGNDEFTQIGQSVNHLISGASRAIHETNTVVSAIASGDFNQRVAGNYIGDLNALKQGVNASAASVSFTMSELQKVMEALGSGNLGLRMDDKVETAYRNMVESALTGINNIIRQTNLVMSKALKGDFSHRIDCHACGDFEVLKDSINNMVEGLDAIINDVNNVMTTRATGDLTQRVNAPCEGKLLELKEAINNSGLRLGNTVEQINLSATAVLTIAQQVDQQSQELTSRIQGQAAALEQTNATMQQMSGSVKDNAHHSHEAASLAEEVQQKTRTGTQVMQQTIDAMSQIREANHKISTIVSLIDSIAFQTNLLALNAAVEAARAGEHGRGFAVVASEVRALAGKSAEAAQEIKTLIEEGVQRIETGTQLADKSGEMLQSISQQIEQVSQTITVIAKATDEQANSLLQTSQAINDIDRMTQENATLVTNTSEAASAMTQQSEQMRSVISFFKTEQQKRLA